MGIFIQVSMKSLYLRFLAEEDGVQLMRSGESMTGSYCEGGKWNAEEVKVQIVVSSGSCD